jgi:hypothetical protein
VASGCGIVSGATAEVGISRRSESIRDGFATGRYGAEIGSRGRERRLYATTPTIAMMAPIRAGSTHQVSSARLSPRPAGVLVGATVAVGAGAVVAATVGAAVGAAVGGAWATGTTRTVCFAWAVLPCSS